MSLKLWLRYPIGKAVRFLEEFGIDVQAHALIVGPVGFLVVWKRKRTDGKTAVQVWEEQQEGARR